MKKYSFIIVFLVALFVWPYAVHEPIHWLVGNAFGTANIHYDFTITKQGLPRPYVTADYEHTPLKVWLFMFLPLAFESLCIIILYRRSEFFGITTYLICAMILQVIHRNNIIADLRFYQILPYYYTIISVVVLLAGGVAYLSQFVKKDKKEKV